LAYTEFTRYLKRGSTWINFSFFFPINSKR
jgi:hypothetical protein